MRFYEVGYLPIVDGSQQVPSLEKQQESSNALLWTGAAKKVILTADQLFGVTAP